MRCQKDDSQHPQHLQLHQNKHLLAFSTGQDLLKALDHHFKEPDEFDLDQLLFSLYQWLLELF